MPEPIQFRAERSDVLFKTFLESGLLLALSVAHLALELSLGVLLLLVVLLVAASLAADRYLFGSIGRAFAVRRALHYKSSPFLAAAAFLVFLLPRETAADKLVLFTLAAGIGGTVTGLLNLGGRSAASA